MRIFLRMSVLSLTGCLANNVQPVIPAELLRPVVVICEDGSKVRALGDCALALRSGLNTANSKLQAIGEMFPND